MEKSFTFSTPDAIEIAYIVQRSQDNPQFMHDMLLHARTLERLLCSAQVNIKKDVKAGSCCDIRED